MMKPISRGEEASLPSFKDAEDAYRYFRERFGRNFMFQKIEEAGDGRKYWHCHLVLDSEAYREGMRTLTEGKSLTGLDFLKSHQTVELMESGEVHIVH